MDRGLWLWSFFCSFKDIESMVRGQRPYCHRNSSLWFKWLVTSFSPLEMWDADRVRFSWRWSLQLASGARFSSWKELNCPTMLFVSVCQPSAVLCNLHLDLCDSSSLVLAREGWAGKKSLVLHRSLAVPCSFGNPETVPALAVQWHSSKCFNSEKWVHFLWANTCTLHALCCY